MIGGSDLLAQLTGMSAESAARLAEHYAVDLRPRLARILTDMAAVAVRKATGEDTATAEIAVTSSLSNLTLEQANGLKLEARDIAFRAALAVIARLLPAP